MRRSGRHAIPIAHLPVRTIARTAAAVLQGLVESSAPDVVQGGATAADVPITSRRARGHLRVV
ncbi:hypothetical protein GCM10028784_25810 [Myceligenerans cantabricum]